MGQQQLLLLVLATVIVGLATVAGIQAFDENQSQAAQDALVQRGTTIMSDLKALGNKPKRLGGFPLNGNKSSADAKAIDRLGYEIDGSDQDMIPVDGAPGDSNCELDLHSDVPSGSQAELDCQSPEAKQDVRVLLKDDGSIATNFGTSIR